MPLCQQLQNLGNFWLPKKWILQRQTWLLCLFTTATSSCSQWGRKTDPDLRSFHPVWSGNQVFRLHLRAGISQPNCLDLKIPPVLPLLPNLGALQSDGTWIRTRTKCELASFLSSTEEPKSTKISFSLIGLKVGSPRVSAIGDVRKICDVSSIWYMQASQIPEWVDLSNVKRRGRQVKQ